MSNRSQRRAGIICEGQGFKMIDGSGEWDVMYDGDETYLQSVHFVDEHNGWAVGQYGSIIRSAPETRKNSPPVTRLRN
jgi:photosystem II stability/assembly factor-like uncharacterized protein